MANATKTKAMMADARRRKFQDIRRALADYIASEGCSCCRDTEAHDEAAERLGKLLGIPKYSDGSGRDFVKFRTIRDEED